MTHAADRNLLFGILALQMDFITRDQLVAAMNAWVLDKAKPLGRILVEQKALRDDLFAALDTMVQKHVEVHNNDAQQSLASLSSVGSTRQVLDQIADPDLQASLAHFDRQFLKGVVGDEFLLAAADRPTIAPTSVRGTDDPNATKSYSVGASTSAGERFRILRPHAEGGLGRVSVARDEELSRDVALKEIKERYADDPGSRSRFLLEAEITGGLEHPGIVPVYGLGNYADGRPFYAMRLIRGDSLKEAIDRFHKQKITAENAEERRVSSLRPSASFAVDFSGLDFRKLLGRFNDVCNAIAYAHSRGVLHRDLKPGNIMLGKYGETLVVDWGLGKLVERTEPEAQARDAGEATLKPASASGSVETIAGQALGTPAYMSPEQAAGRLDLLGPASDVYSLGATLYSVLTGRAPFEGSDIGVMLANVQMGEFPPPRRLKPGIDPALNAICMKAMATKPEDRYATARLLADDIEHWLADEPVSAWLEPWRVKGRRWVGRHRVLVGSGIAASLVLLAAVVIGLVVVNKKHEEAIHERQIARAVQDFLQRDLLRQASLWEQSARLARWEDDGFGVVTNPSVRELLDRAVAEVTPGTIDKKFPNQPLVQAEILLTLGVSYRNLDHHCQGNPEVAIPLLVRARDICSAALGPDHPKSLAAKFHLALSYQRTGKLDDALSLLEATYDKQRAILGVEDEQTLETMLSLAFAYLKQSNNNSAASVADETLAAIKQRFGEMHPEGFRRMAALTGIYKQAGQLKKALAMGEDILAKQQELLGSEHVDSLGSALAQIYLYLEADRAEKAFALAEETFAIANKKLGPDHIMTIMSAQGLAATRINANQQQNAVPLLEQAYAMAIGKLGPDHIVTELSRMQLLFLYEDIGPREKALPLREHRLAKEKVKFGVNDSRILKDMRELALDFLAVKQPDKAVPLLHDFLAVQKNQIGRDETKFAEVQMEVGVDLLRHGQPVAAEPILRASLRILKKQQTDSWMTYDAKSLLGAALMGQEEYIDAESLLVSGYDGLKVRESKIPAQVRQSLLGEACARVVLLYDTWGQKEKAAKWRKYLENQHGK